MFILQSPHPDRETSYDQVADFTRGGRFRLDRHSGKIIVTLEDATAATWLKVAGWVYLNAADRTPQP